MLVMKRNSVTVKVREFLMRRNQCSFIRALFYLNILLFCITCEDKTRIWPYLISEKIGYKLVNEAECGASNELIVDKTLKYFSNPPQHHFDDVQNHFEAKIRLFSSRP